MPEKKFTKSFYAGPFPKYYPPTAKIDYSAKEVYGEGEIPHPTEIVVQKYSPINSSEAIFEDYMPPLAKHKQAYAPSTSPVQVDVGIRYDDGKLPMHLLPPELMIEVAKVLDFGAKKYAPRNWELGMDWSRVYGSLMRHLIKWQGGEDIDPETGLNHIAHVACNAAFLLAYINREKGKDDRPKDN